MVIIDRWLDWLTAQYGFTVTRWSLIRITAAIVVALAVVSSLAPGRVSSYAEGKYNALATKSTRNVALPYGDTRGFRPALRPQAYRIAWIGGSEMLGKGPGQRAFIPALVTRKIGKVNGSPMSTDLYYEDAIRLTDQLSALTSAVASKPDMVVVSLNPVWSMNDLAVQQWGYLDGNLALHGVRNPALWPILASLVSPGDVGWKAVSSISSPINDRYAWGLSLAEKTAGLSFLDEVAGATPPTPAGLTQFGRRRPVDFFFERSSQGRSGEGGLAGQLGMLERETASRSQFNSRVLGAMLDVVRRAGVDAYFYLAPISSAVYQVPEAKRLIDELRTLLESAARGRTGPRVVLDTRALQERLPSTGYEDLVHVLDPKPAAGILAEELCTLLVQWGNDPLCEGVRP